MVIRLCGPCDGAERLDDIELLPARLPPLPTPNYDERRRESCCGCVCVLGTVATCVALTVGFSSVLERSVRLPLLCLIAAEAAVAIGCLAGLLLGDPGVVRRTQETCLPVPAEVAERLSSGAPLRDEVAPMSGMTNIRDGDRSYCVRCFLWRDHAPPPAACEAYSSRRDAFARRWCGMPESWPGRRAEVAVHHCSTCQRCVRDFDHHCGVFGRCIAGRGLRGNMKFFLTIIGMGWAGAVTCGAAVVLGLLRGG